MKWKAIAKGFLITTLCILLTGAAQVPAKVPEQSMLDQVYKLDPALNTMSYKRFVADFDQDGKNEYFLVFTNRGDTGDDVMGISARLCTYDNGKASLYQNSESQSIVPGSFGIQKLAGIVYFRYDLAYATDSQTILLSMKNEKPYQAFAAPGGATFRKTSSFTVLCSSYDLTRMKSDAFLVGHTWKDYYFYADQKGFHEYKAKKISQKEFLRYKGSADILQKINQEFRGKYLRYTLQYLARSNSLVHINIALETKDSFDYCFKTYRLENKTLKLVQTGEGNYVLGILR